MLAEFRPFRGDAIRFSESFDKNAIGSRIALKAYSGWLGVQAIESVEMDTREMQGNEPEDVVRYAASKRRECFLKLLVSLGDAARMELEKE